MACQYRDAEWVVWTCKGSRVLIGAAQINIGRDRDVNARSDTCDRELDLCTMPSQPEDADRVCERRAADRRIGPEGRLSIIINARIKARDVLEPTAEAWTCIGGP